MLISNENIAEIQKLMEDITKSVIGVNDLNIEIRDFKHNICETIRKVSSLKYQVELKDEKINNLKKE